jgi:hypothetical protein
MRFLPCNEENGGDKSVAVRGNTEGKEMANLFVSDLVVIREREYFLAVSNKIFPKVVPGVPRCKWREGGVSWGLLEAFIGANVLQEIRLARIFLILAKSFKWQACMYVSQCIPSCALMCICFARSGMCLL